MLRRPLTSALAIIKMLADSISVLLLIALLVFILWEGWQHRGTKPLVLSRAELEGGFVPGASAYKSALFFAAGAVLVCSISFFVYPPHPPFEGRGALIGAALFGWFGPWGIPVCTLLLAALLCGLALMRRRSREAMRRDG